jgi:hypothetical protein
MADETVDIDVNINTNTGEAEGSFKRLQSQIKETTTLLQAAEAAGDTVSFKKYKAQLDDLQDQLEITNLKQQQFDDTLAAAPGPLGKAGQAVKAFDGALKFLAANPVIAILAGLAAILFAVKEALDKTTEGQAALSTVTEAFGNIITPIINFISAVAVPVVGLFADAVNGLAIALGLVNEEQVAAQEEYRQYAIDVKKANAVLQSQIDVLEAKGEKEADIAGRSKQIIDNEISLLEKKRAAFGKLTAEEEAQIIALQGKKAVIDAKEQTRLAKVAEQAIKTKAEFQNKLDQIDIDAIENEAVRAISARQEKYTEDLKALENDLEFIKLSDDRKKFIREQLVLAANQDIAKINKDARIQDLDDELKFLALKGEGLAKNSQSFFDNQFEILRVAHDKEVLENEGNAAKLLAIEQKYTQSKKELRQQELNAVLQNASTILSAVGNIFSQASNNAKMQQEIDIENAEGNVEKIEEIKRKGFEDNKKIQIAQAIISTLQGAISAYTSLAVIPVVGPVLGFAAAAAALVFGYKQVDLIKQQQYKSSSSGTTSSTGGIGNSSTPFSSPSIGTPQIGVTSAQTGTIAGITAGTVAANNSIDRPLKAYVIGNDITTQQQLDRRLRTMARLGG